jgi:hypothetical protein
MFLPEAAAPASALTTFTSTGTFSASGATPIATSSGTVIYQQISIGGDGTVITGNGNSASTGQKSGASGLSVGEKAGIATGIIGAVLTAAGVWYARKTFLDQKRKKKNGELAINDQSADVSMGDARYQVPSSQRYELGSSSQA